jgi:4'-phosphopantetheinyl transferase
MIELYSIKIDRIIDYQIFDQLMAYLDKDKQLLIKAFYKIEDSQRALVSDVLIRAIAIYQIGIDNWQIQLGKNKYGKPFLKNYPDFHFNISHSGEWVVCAVDDEPIGIDIEKIQDIDLSIIDRFFSIKEVMDIYSLPQKEQLPYFYDIWTLKESYIKAWGKGFSIPLDSFSIRVYMGGKVDIDTHNSFKECCFKQFSIDDGYKLSVCSLKNGFPKCLFNWNLNNILHFLERKRT